MTDFEQGLIDAFTNVFLGAQMRGCFFHFGQCLWRKIQNLPEIRQKYVNDPDFGLKIKQLIVLVFVPVSHIEENFNKFMSQQFFEDNEELLLPLIDYFEETLIGRPTRRNKRRPPIFDLKLWNQFDSTQAVASHSTIWRLIEVLKKEQHLTDIKINRFIAGQEPPAKKKKISRCC
ncbi:hypothetical protein AGLY_015132 [Aphis glycines]|uniref:MULE transposase domain-containing protein n=1 Tax=Aphis glycines TaxID=307491 RepID=A0A6G0T3B2_APHGL|nr:hypothetical protein AGLY_015132 [Aphis glycines]